MRIYAFSGLFLLTVLVMGCAPTIQNDLKNQDVEKLILQHAKAWETGDYKLLDSILHEELIFAYPGRRLNKSKTLQDFLEFHETFNETKIYINKIIIDGDELAVEWQFASTNRKTGNRTAVSDAIIGKIQDNKIIVWKEYLDGRVSRLQIAGNLSLEEGAEPFPWPKKN
jgi:ketosteroid isomerase-like protein